MKDIISGKDLHNLPPPKKKGVGIAQQQTKEFKNSFKKKDPQQIGLLLMPEVKSERWMRQSTKGVKGGRGGQNQWPMGKE